jgi:hypothetical protein
MRILWELTSLVLTSMVYSSLSAAGLFLPGSPPKTSGQGYATARSVVLSGLSSIGKMRGWTVLWALSNALVATHAFQHSGLQLQFQTGRIYHASKAVVGKARAGGVSSGQLRMSGFGFGGKKDSFKYTGSQRVSVWPSKLKEVPDSVMKPEYALRKDGKPAEQAFKMPWDIYTNTPEDIAGIRQGENKPPCLWTLLFMFLVFPHVVNN